MSGLCFKRLQVVVARHCSIAVNSVDRFRCFQNGPLFKAQPDEKDISFTVSYLVNSCGFSPELALSVCRKENTFFNSPEKPDSVIKILKDYGLSDAHVSKIVKKRPRLLLYNAEDILLPKLELLNSVGISGNSLARLLCQYPRVLSSSLEERLIPFYNFSKTLRIPEEKVPGFFINCVVQNLKVEELSNVACNVSILRAHGVPEASSHLWLPNVAETLAFDTEKVKENVNKVISVGISPSSPIFMNALYVISVTDASKWEEKMDFYKKWGWTEDDVLLAFRESPMFISFSEQNVSTKLDLFLNKMGYRPADVARHPDVLSYSLEKRIIPRCSVIRILQWKGLVRKGLSLDHIVTNSEKKFLEKYVIKYKEQVPDLFSIFQGKMTLAELGLGLEE